MSKDTTSLSETDLALLTKTARFLVTRRMSSPAILFLESVRPLNFVGSQAMLFFAPVVRAFLNVREYENVQKLLEKRESIGILIDLIENEENRFLSEEKKKKVARKRSSN